VLQQKELIARAAAVHRVHHRVVARMAAAAVALGVVVSAAMETQPRPV